MLFELVSTLTAGLFTGAAIYINLVEHPARIECGTDLAVAEFRSSYKKAARMQASLALSGFLSSVAAWFLGSSLGWLVGGMLLGIVIPFTLVAIMPTNKRLLDPSLEKNSHIASQLLLRWERLHAVRSFLGLASFLVFLSLAVGS